MLALSLLSFVAAEEMEIQSVPTEAPQFTEPLHDCKANEGTTAQLEVRRITGATYAKLYHSSFSVSLLVLLLQKSFGTRTTSRSKLVLGTLSKVSSMAGRD